MSGEFTGWSHCELLDRVSSCWLLIATAASPVSSANLAYGESVLRDEIALHHWGSQTPAWLSSDVIDR